MGSAPCMAFHVCCPVQKPSIPASIQHFNSIYFLLVLRATLLPVNELREAVTVTSIEGEIPDDFPEGTNPLYGVKATRSLLGRSSDAWVEGEGMVHALYFKKITTDRSWTLAYNNRYIESKTFMIEKQLNKHFFLPAVEGDSLSVLSAYLLNWSAPGTGEVVIMGFQATKPFVEVGVVSAGGKKLLHKVDLNYTVFFDCPISRDINRLVQGGPLIKFKKDESARIGIMPRYGDVDSNKWFDVKPNCTYHIINCFEDGNEIVVWGCRDLESIIPGPDFGKNKFEWFWSKFRPIGSVGESGDAVTEDELIFSRPYEWRLDMHTGDVKERNLTGTEFGLDFPIINEAFTGLKNKYSCMQVVQSIASSAAGIPKYGGQAKLYFEELIKS
ncbi:hypothetical protein SLEP1_g15728 [Rubroshorea leprosula]|uniref:Carotenoid oxygenase n=1 Tax=Rubroshorea leprosula TaxID=152421 RepID=A0AAV5J012_9ROSI|nr:hypothetical protein SLEP1_g15728 [Rubroshorea leprosula]